MTLLDFKKKVASKKFIGFLLLLLSANALVFFGKIDASHWQSVVSIVAPLYFASDVAQDWVKSKGDV